MSKETVQRSYKVFKQLYFVQQKVVCAFFFSFLLNVRSEFLRIDDSIVLSDPDLRIIIRVITVQQVNVFV